MTYQVCGTSTTPEGARGRRADANSNIFVVVLTELANLQA